MTGIGMAIDPTHLARIKRRRGRRRVAAEIVIAAIAVTQIAGAGFILSQRGAATELVATDLLNDFRSNPVDMASQPAASPVGPSSSTVQTASDVPETNDGPTEAAAADGTKTPGTPVAIQETEGQAGGDTKSGEDVADDVDGSSSDNQSTPVASFVLPDEGLYTYNSSGYEKISLGGARHDYPEQTYVIVEHQGGCDWTFDHRVLEEHRSTSSYCTQGRDTVAVAYDGEITFYGSKAESNYTCDRGVRARAADNPGAEHVGSCTDGEGTSNDVVRFVGVESMSIGGQSVQALHYAMESVHGGSVDGATSQDLWLHPDTSLPLKIVRSTKTKAYEFGSEVTYTEEATFVLSSLDAQR